MTLQLGEKHFSSAQPESTVRRIVTFKVGDRTFGIDVGMVREIKGWQTTTPLPHAAPHVRGVLNLRGVILAVYDLRTSIGLGQTEATATHVIVVVDIEDKVAGLLVDSVSDIVDVPVSAVRPAPDLERDEHGLIEGLVLLDTDIVALLDLGAVIRDGGVDPATMAKTARAN
ncbi:MAG: chemotaxis protein CheW [Beijerinckiaceae bacterium]|nr:chemotaxis protein CheW [Beijerinckiaceae bacterium]